MRKYGLPYMGSKSAIADWVVEHLPSADTFYDVFAGGCAITHRAILSNKWRRIVCNDITDAPQLFVDAVHGKYHGCDRWVSRAEFEMFKDADPFVRILWSFGNDQKTYMYSREIEPYKKALHRLMFAKSVHERRIAYKYVLRELQEYLNMTGDIYKSEQSLESLQSLERLERLQSLESLESLERLERLQSLESLESLERLERLQSDYRGITFDENSVIYCDPPYRGTKGYINNFDHEEFYQWCREQTNPIFISEYDMPDDFTVVAEKTKLVNLSATCTGKAIERIYTYI